jgi:hypothetical protein
MADMQSIGDLRNRGLLPFEVKRGSAGDNFEIRTVRQSVDQLFRQPVGKVLITGRRFDEARSTSLPTCADPVRVDSNPSRACLKSAPRQVLGKPVTRDLRAIPALPPQR